MASKLSMDDLAEAFYNADVNGGDVLTPSDVREMYSETSDGYREQLKCCILAVLRKLASAGLIRLVDITEV